MVGSISKEQEQIAKDITLAMINNSKLAGIIRKNESAEEYNAAVGEAIGTMYQAILSKVCDHDTIFSMSEAK